MSRELRQKLNRTIARQAHTSGHIGIGEGGLKASRESGTNETQVATGNHAAVYNLTFANEKAFAALNMRPMEDAWRYSFGLGTDQDTDREWPYIKILGQHSPSSQNLPGSSVTNDDELPVENLQN